VLAQLQADYPGLTYDMEGGERERRKSMQSMGFGFLVAMVMVYALQGLAEGKDP